MPSNVDSLGNKLTPEQIKYFENSKARDDKGNLLVCYHGTKTPGFKEFDPSKSDSSQFGSYKFKDYNVTYFTTDKGSAISYTKYRLERDGNVYVCYVNIINPYIIDEEEDIEVIRNAFNIRDKKLREFQMRKFKSILDKWFNTPVDKIDIDSVNKDFFPFNIRLSKNSYNDYYNIYNNGNNSAYGREYIVLRDYTLEEIFTDKEIYDLLLDDILGFDDEDYFFTTDDIVRYVLLMNKEEGTNYDGIIIKKIFDSASVLNSINGTDIITLQSSNQIKLITNRKPTSSNNIDEVLTEGMRDYNIIVRKKKHPIVEEDESAVDVIQDEIDSDNDIMIDDTIDDSEPDLSRNTEILSLIYKQTHIKNINGNNLPSYCFVDEIMNVYGLSQEEVVKIALDNNYKIMKVFPNETVDDGLLIADKQCSAQHIETDYEKFYGVEVDVEDYKGE